MAKTTKSQARTKRERSEFLWGWLFILATPLLVKQARYVLRESDPLAMRPMLEKTVKGALLTNLLFVIGIIASKLAA